MGLQNMHYYNRREFNVNEYQIEEEQSLIFREETHFEDISQLSPSIISEKLQELPSFDEQLNRFVKEVNITDQMREIYNSICFCLKRELSKKFPKCTVDMFGSTVSGLGFKNSDLDFYVDLGTDQVEDKSNPVEKTKIVFSKIKKVLYRKPGLFKQIIPISQARVPIIKFIHGPTGVACDISLSNSLGIYNSQLVKHYFGFDDRLKPAMLVIKYWAKELNLTGSGFISNYALVMMFLFYAQQPNVALVPTILQLRQKSIRKVVEGWQVNFNKFHQHYNCKNKMNVAEIITGFFEFYCNFNYNDMVICPLDGVARARQTFDDWQNLPDYMDQYKQYASSDVSSNKLFKTSSPICVQDPNELCLNITAVVSHKKLEEFIKQCRYSYVICSEKIATADLRNCSFLLGLLNVCNLKIGVKIKKKKNKKKITAKNTNLC